MAMSLGKVIFITHLLLNWSPFVQDFLIDYPCPTTPPCTCGSPDTNSIYCNSKHLTQFPAFISSTRKYPDFKIYIQNNAITSVPDNAFLALASNFNRSVFGSIYLSNNQISKIADQAFNGISDKIYRIYLSKNNLTTIPAALATITHLDTLQIDGNPISTLNFDTMSAVGKTLRHIVVDMNKFAAWPPEMGLLSNIFEVKLNAIPFRTIPDDAFQNWNHLGSLTITNSQLETIPEAICYVNSISYSFYFNKNNNITEDVPIFPGCTNSTSRLDNVSSATFKDNDLISISNILETFRNLNYLTISGNPRMFYVMFEHVPYNHSLYTLTADHNKFDRIPEALQKLNNLYTLDLSNNAIGTIQRHDLDGFSNLHVLKLRSNPIIYVSSEAFISSVHLTTIYLQDTNLTQIPQGVVGLQNLTQLDLAGSPVTCACDTMSHFRKWTGHVYWYSKCNGTCVYLNGLCHISQKNLADFLKNTLPNCP